MDNNTNIKEIHDKLTTLEKFNKDVINKFTKEKLELIKENKNLNNVVLEQQSIIKKLTNILTDFEEHDINIT